MAHRAGRAHRLGTKSAQTRHNVLVTLAAGGGPGCPIGPPRRGHVVRSRCRSRGAPR
jgi:hypothetical protein